MKSRRMKGCVEGKVLAARAIARLNPNAQFATHLYDYPLAKVYGWRPARAMLTGDQLADRWQALAKK